MNDTARMLADTAERLFEAECQKAVLIAAENDEWPAKLWSAVEDSGLALALAPESKGGVGLDTVDALQAVRIAARHAAPLPLAETLLASWLIADTDLAMPSGPLTIAPVTGGDVLTLTKTAGGFRLQGSARRVPFARHATHIVVLAESDGGHAVAIVDRTKCTITPATNIAREARDTVDFAVDLPVDAVAPAPATVTPGDLRAFGAAMRTVQIAGALSRTLDLTVRYAGERVQFGKPIAKFQAVQHQIAMLAAHSAAATAAGDMAAEAAGDGMEPLLIGAAKARAGEAASAGAAIAHQVHGAIGFTHEHMLHFSTKRLWSWRDEFGKESDWSLLLGRAALAAGGRQLWSDLITA